MSPAITVEKISNIESAVAEAALVLADARRMAEAIRELEESGGAPALALNALADAAASFLRIAADRIRESGFWESSAGIAASDFLSFNP